jgi:hypothetical protein
MLFPPSTILPSPVQVGEARLPHKEEKAHSPVPACHTVRLGGVRARFTEAVLLIILRLIVFILKSELNNLNMVGVVNIFKFII